jgi:cell division protease FtsH
MEMDELEESIDRVIAGPERKSRKISPKEKEITAYHEAGHALVGKMLPNIEPLRKVTIIPRGMMGGYARFLEEDRRMYTRSRCNDVITTLLGGHAAEKLIFNETTDGASSDIKRATVLARKMVTDFGMSDKLGPRTFGDKQEMVFLGHEISEQKDYGNKVADTIDEEVNKIIRTANRVAKRLLTENKSKLTWIAGKLVAQETLEGEELELLFTEPVPSPLPEATATPVPTPAKASTKTKPVSKKTRVSSRLIPKQVRPLPNQG